MPRKFLGGSIRRAASRRVSPALDRLEPRTLLSGGTPHDGFLDVVFVSDGYSDMAAFHADVEKSIDRLLKYEPYKSRKEQFRFQSLENTQWLNIGFAGSSLRAGWNLIEQVVADAGISADYVTVITDLPGSFGGVSTSNDRYVVVTRETAGYYVQAHELGHAIAGLSDEYLSGGAFDQPLDQKVYDGNRYAGSPPAAEWADLVAPDEYALGVGDATNWYRPSHKSLMNVNGGGGYNVPSLLKINESLDYWAGPLADNQAPTVKFKTLANGAAVDGVAKIPLELNDDFGVVRTQLWVDGKLARNSFEAPYDLIWTTGSVPLGTHRLLVKAFDNVGNVGVTPEITVNLTRGSDFDIVEPKAGSTLSMRSKDEFEVALATRFSRFSSLELLINGQLVGSVYPVPTDWRFTPKFGWLDEGKNTLTIIASDYSTGEEVYRDTISVIAKRPEPLYVDFADPKLGFDPLSGIVALPVLVSSGKVTRVEFSVDDVSVAVDEKAPFSFSLDTRKYKDGRHSLGLKASGAADDFLYAFELDFSNNTGKPVVTMAAPAANATLTGLVAVKTQVRTGYVQWVKLYVDGKLASTSWNSPFGFKLDTRKWKDGKHTLKLLASGPKGTSQVSRAVVFRNAADRVAPVVTLSAPKNNASFGAGGLHISGRATDNTSVARVELFVDDSKIATSTKAQYQFHVMLANLKKGRHKVRVRAIDATGNIGQSRVIYVNKTV